MLEAPGPFRQRRVEVIDAGDGSSQRHGRKAVFLARWIALVRFAAAWLAGINHMPFREFFFWNALGGITWGITFGLVGYFRRQRRRRHDLDVRLYAFGALLGCVFLAWFDCRDAQAAPLSARRGRSSAPSVAAEAEPATAPRGRTRPRLGVTALAPGRVEAPARSEFMQ